MPLEKLVSYKAFGTVALSIDKADVTDNWLTNVCFRRPNLLIDIADPLQLVGMSMVMRTSIYADQEDGKMSPIKTKQFELEFVHCLQWSVKGKADLLSLTVCGFSI
jgi:hypothetical protein